MQTRWRILKSFEELEGEATISTDLPVGMQETHACTKRDSHMHEKTRMHRNSAMQGAKKTKDAPICEALLTPSYFKKEFNK